MKKPIILILTASLLLFIALPSINAAPPPPNQVSVDRTLEGHPWGETDASNQDESVIGILSFDDKQPSESSISFKVIFIESISSFWNTLLNNGESFINDLKNYDKQE